MGKVNGDYWDYCDLWKWKGYLHMVKRRKARTVRTAATTASPV